MWGYSFSIRYYLDAVAISAAWRRGWVALARLILVIGAVREPLAGSSVTGHDSPVVPREARKAPQLEYG